MVLWLMLACGGGDPGKEWIPPKLREIETPIADTGAMTEIPGGTFIMGHPDEPMGPYGNSWKSNELPPHEVTVSSFWLDVDEVTVAEWVDFLDAHLQGAPEAAVHHHPLQPVTWDDGGFASATGEGSRPARMVSWFDAVTYCAWVGKRLPTEAEWERAAKGLEEADKGFPYGRDRPSCDEAVFFTNRALCEPGPASVGSRSPAGDSPEGVHDLAGNVAEWTSDWYGAYSSATETDPAGPDGGTRRVLRGGGFRDTSDGLRTMARLGVDPHSRSEGIGFRCAW
jgi:sulfatase modifying factor 1